MPTLFDWRGGPTSTWFSSLDRPTTLPINVDLLAYKSRQHFRRDRMKEAQEGYRECVNIAPTDGRGYLGLSRVQARKGNNVEARKSLAEGLKGGRGANVFLLRHHGGWVERGGHLAEDETFYLKATRVR